VNKKIQEKDVDEDSTSNVSPAARDLGSLVKRIEKLKEDQKALATDVKSVFDEAKAAGFDTKIVRMVVKRRAMDRADLEEQDSLLATYETNLDSVLD
jgi:uncharacterized protein (UPF0335 family)